MNKKSSPSLIEFSGSNSGALLLTFFALNAYLIYLIYSKNFIFGSESGNWDYSYFKTTIPVPVWIPIAVFLLLAVLVFMGSKLIFSYEIMTLSAGWLIAVFNQYLLRRIYRFPLGAIVESDLANSFYSASMRYSPIELLSQFTNLAQTFPYHAKSNMPGKILLFHLFNLFTTSPQRMGYLVILLSALGGLLLYEICMKLFHDRQVAFYAFILYALIPSKLVFYPILNTVTPVFILLCLYLFLVYLDRKQYFFLGILGIAIYLLVLFEPSPLVLGIVFIGILLNAIGENRVSRKDMWAILFVPTLGFLGTYILVSSFFHFDMFQAFQYVLIDAVDYNLKDKHDYWIWILENPKEFFYAAGIPVMLIFVYMSSLILSHWKSLTWNITRWSIEIVYIVSLLITFCVVLFLGINRGEITRLWIYLAVFFQVPAAYFLAKMVKSKSLLYLVSCTLVIQSVISLQSVSFIGP